VEAVDEGIELLEISTEFSRDCVRHAWDESHNRQ
jgi:hypothetical protein